MIEIASFIHFITIAFAVAINAIGVGIGQGLTSVAALRAINEQPKARADIMQTSILGIALIETAAVMGTFVSFLLLVNTKANAQSPLGVIAEIGIACAICLPGFVLGIVSAQPAQAACMAVARQPFFSQKIVRFMLITLSLIQTPIIFGLVVAMIIQNQASSVIFVRDTLRLIGAGIAIGLGSVGPAIGLAAFAKTACEGLGVNRKAYNEIFSFTLISQAIVETPVIFSMVIAIILLFVVPTIEVENTLQGITLLAAGMCTGIGTIGPGISSGKTSAMACKQIALKPETHSLLSRTSMLAQGLIETSAIYPVLISFSLIYLAQ